MMRVAIAVVVLSTSTVFAQPAATTKPKPAVHHTTTARPAAATADSAEANGPGIPKAAGVPKTLYALRYVDLVIGTGEPAAPRKWYTVNYTGWLRDGTKFDSSVDRNQPFTFPYGAHRVITGWDTGFEGMRIGGKRRLIVPYELAYGEVANEKIPAKSTLIFDVELLGMSDTPPAAPAAPKPAAAPDTTAPKPDNAPAAVPAPGPGPKPGSAPGPPANPSSPAPAAPANAPGNPGHPDPAKLPGGPPSGV